MKNSYLQFQYPLFLSKKCSVFRLVHLMNVSVSLNAWLCMVDLFLRLRTVEIVPWLVGMIKTELIGMEYGWEMDDPGVCRAGMV